MKGLLPVIGVHCSVLYQYVLHVVSKATGTQNAQKPCAP